MGIVSVNLTFDESSEDEIYALWRRLSSKGVAIVTADRYRPHITLAAYDPVDPAALSRVVSKVAGRFKAMELGLSPLGSFPENGVLFMAPRVSRELLSLHHYVLDQVATELQADLISNYLMRDQWVPHVSLVKLEDKAKLAEAFRVTLDQWKPIEVNAIAIATRVHPSLEDFSVHRFST